MFHHKRCLALVLIPAMLAAALSGCIRPDDIGAAILVEPESLEFGLDSDTLTLDLAKNTSSTGQGPIVIVPTESWISVDDCASAADECLSKSPFDNITVNVTVDRSRMTLGENLGSLIVYAGNSPVVEIPIKAVDVLKADFKADVRRVEIGEVINFTNLSETTETAGPIISQEWNFGDGSSSTQVNRPNKIYSAPGHYDVSLTVRTETMEETLTRVAYVSVGDVLPVVDFSVDKTVIAEGEGVAFADETYLSDRPDVDLTNFIEAWHWDFGDGTTSDKRSPVHQFTSVGNYTITLTVSTPFGDYSATKENLIHVQRRLGPTADFYLPQSPQPIRRPLEFKDLSDPGSDPITQWFWEFGDGTSSTQQDPTHTYTEADTYDVTLTVTTASGNSDKTRSITVQFEPPKADFVADDVTPAVGQPVEFTDLSEPGSDTIVSWTWDFGDGTTSTDREPLHTYTAATAEPLTVTLTVRSNAPAPLNVDSEVKTGYIMVYVPPTPAFDLELTEEYGRSSDDNASVITDDVVQFVNLTEVGTEENISYFWEFGDGGTSFAEEPSHTYDEPGFYTVRLTAATDTQLQRTQRVITVDSPPTVDFSATPRTVISGAEIQFEDLSEPGEVPVPGQVEPAEGNLAGWLWDFGDGESANTKNPTHTYPLPDRYDVTLTVYFQHSGSGGTLSVSLSRNNYINILQPTDMVVNTLSDILDGDTRSIAHLILDPGEDGLYSLREAIEATNSQDGSENILFSVEGTITPEGDLPPITDEDTVILAEGKIVLDGAMADSSGITLNSSGAYISGFGIVNFPDAGVKIAGGGATENTVRGCRIGNDGALAVPNAYGVWITEDAEGNFIGGVAEGDRNIISGNFFEGILIDQSESEAGPGGNVIAGNYIGVDGTGLAALANDGAGIQILNSASNIIGGSEAARNIISANGDDGIVLAAAGTLSTTIQGNYIGTDVTGANGLGNGARGVAIEEGASLSRLGGSSDGQSNVISANAGAGIVLSGADTSQNRIANNYIGLTFSGDVALGNVGAGVVIYQGASTNLLGLAQDNGGNFICGNGDAGVILSGENVENNFVSNNYIGTTANVEEPPVEGKALPIVNLGNLAEGVRIEGGAAANIVGGDAEFTGNTIAFNSGDGILIAGDGSDENLVQGNEIDLNDQSGISVQDGATRARIGRVLASFTAAASNIIRANEVYGVAVRGSQSLAVSIRANAITENTYGPIWLGNGANMGVEAPYVDGFEPVVRGWAPPFSVVDFFVDGQDPDETTGDAVQPHFVYVGSVNARVTGRFEAPDVDTEVFNFHAGKNIYVTATDPFGNTSQYSNPVPIPIPAN